MRPSILDPFFASVASLPGVGPKVAKLFDRLLAEPDKPARIVDLIFHLPTSLIDRRLRANLNDVPLNTPVTVAVTIEEHRPPPYSRAKAPYRIIAADDGGQDLALVFFHAQRPRLEALLPIGARRWISGRIEMFDGRMQMVHPDRVLDEKGFAALADFEPVYPATEGLTQRLIGKSTAAALETLPVLPEWIDASLAARDAFPAFAAALRTLHLPQSPDALEPEKPARRRLAYDELLASQLALVLVRARMRRGAGRSHQARGRLAETIIAALPFSLTKSQAEAIAEIRADLEKPQRMLRLLQGDVGSGKTLVGLLAIAHVVEAGKQAAMMAPTEILARQHFERIKPLAEAADLRIAILTGRDKASERNRVLAGLADGTIDLVVGTHALFQDEVVFRDLALAVVDEQHRFGVHQRLALGRKGEAVDVLVMTATPIPRTLVLTFFGDIDVSTLREKPAGRQPIDTRTVALERYDEVVEAIGRALEGGAQVYWVCPIVSESEALDIAAAEERVEALHRQFGAVVDLLHGKMKGAEKDEAMARFSRGQTRLLVATTVIEVGVDVPSATIMVVEHAERFGLAQLHQLRGRIGRGSDRSTCILLYKGPLGETAKARLAIMRETEDGFRIAEEDLRLRGEGDLLGRKQSGMPGFRLARPEIDADLLETARDDAKLIVATDPGLKSDRGQALRVLLYLFERDEAARLIEAG